MTDIINARITSTMLGFEDHGIFTYVLQLEYDKSSSQAFGNFSLGSRKIGYADGMLLLMHLLDTVGVSKWEDLPGKLIRVYRRNDGMIGRIGNILEDKWFDHSDYVSVK